MLVLGRKRDQEIVLTENSTNYQIKIKINNISYDYIKICLIINDLDIISTLHDEDCIVLYTPRRERIIIKLVEMCDSFVKLGFICDKSIKIVRQELLKSSA